MQFQFRLRTLFLLFVILWCALAACGPAGALVAAAIVFFAALIFYGRPTVIELLVMVAIIGTLLGLLLPAIVTGLSPEDCQRICRALHLKHLAVALSAYHDEHGSFPPAYTVDGAGKRVHGWRVQMLPFLTLSMFNAKEKYEQYDFNEPWNGPKNSKVSFDVFDARHGGSEFCCPSDPSYWQACNYNAASFFAVVGPKAAWRGSQPTRLDDLRDRGRRMILLVEADNRGINWKEPKDLTYEEAAAGINRQSGPGISSTHVIGDDYFHNVRRGAYVAFVDGSVHFLPEDIAIDDLRALLTGDTSRRIDLESFERPGLNWSHIVALPLLILSGGVLVVGSLVQRRRAGERRAKQQHHWGK
jgi:hypothetical protein